MAGPVYYSDLYNGPKCLPEYYDGSIGFMMDRADDGRSLFPNGEFNKMEPFADHIKVNNLYRYGSWSDGEGLSLNTVVAWFF